MDVRRVAARGAVGDALPGEPLEPLDPELPPRDAAGEDDRPRAEDVAAVEVHLPRRRVDPRDRPRHEHLGAEPPRLLQRAARELVARDARGEAEVVLDPGRGAGLAAGRLPLDHDRAQTLGRAVDGRGEPSRAGADDDGVVLGGGGLGGEAEQLRHPAQLRPDDRLPVDHPDRRAVVGGRHRAAPLLGGVRRVGGDPLEADLVAVEEVPQVGAVGIEAVSDHERARRRRVGGDALQPARPRHPVGREPADLLRDVGLDGRDGVVVVRLDPQHARRLGARAEADREDRPERDRHLAEDVADLALADDARDPVDELDRLDAAVEDGEERPLAALVRRVLPGRERDVRRRAREPLPVGLGRGRRRSRSTRSRPR